MSEIKFLTPEEVSERYRGGVSIGTLRNWRAMKIGPSFVKIGKAVLYPIDELEAWDEGNRALQTYPTPRHRSPMMWEKSKRFHYVVRYRLVVHNHPELMGHNSRRPLEASFAIPSTQIPAALKAQDPALALASLVDAQNAVRGIYASGDVDGDEAFLRYEGVTGNQWCPRCTVCPTSVSSQNRPFAGHRDDRRICPRTGYRGSDRLRGTHWRV